VCNLLVGLKNVFGGQFQNLWVSFMHRAGGFAALAHYVVTSVVVDTSFG
jgi:hypothetical protein